MLCWQVNFEDCWLEYVNPVAFSGLERLSALNLVNNELRTLNAEMQATLPSTLRILRLYRNPWTCNCRLRWLRRWLVSPVTHAGSAANAVDTTINWDFASNTPTCAAPALIRSVAWRHLTPDQFACPSRIISVSAAGTSNNGTTTTTGIRATSGLNATVKCMAAGDPEPIISWSRGDRGGHVLAPPKALISVRQGTVGDDGEPRILSTLTLVGVSASRDSGDYSCMAENTAGRAEMTFKLMVDDAPLSDTSRTGLGPIDRDAFLGTVIGLLAVVCVIVLCTVLRLRTIARRRRRLHNKNVYYVADTANHVGPSPTSNHCPPTEIKSTPLPAHAFVDDADSKSSEEQSFVGERETMTGSPRYPLLPGYNQHCRSERSEENGRRGRKKHGEASCRRERDGNSGEVRSLLSADGGGELEPGMTEDEVRDNDEVRSVSEKLSDVASDDADERQSNGDDAANHRERPSRAVSFGPDMIIDTRRCSSSAGERDDSPHDNDGGAEVQCETEDKDRGQSVYQRHDEPVYQRPAVNCSPSVDRRPLANRPPITGDRRTTAQSPALSVGDSPRLTTFAGRRHSGELALVGNGSVRTGSGSRLPCDHPLSPQTPVSAPFSRSRQSSQSASLERNAGGKARRRLPIPVNTGLRRSPGPGMFGGIGRRQHALSLSPRDVALPGNHVAECGPPVSLAELLAPPFGGTAAALRQLQQARQALKTVTDPRRPHQRSNANCVFDDDSGTDI